MKTRWDWRDFRDWRTQFLWLSVSVTIAALLFQGNRGLWGTDEGRYSNVALLMLESGDWLVPHRHPEFAHYTKPPLTYWAIALSVKVFGMQEWALRLPSALAFIGTTLLTFLIGQRLVPKRAWLAPVIFFSNLVAFLAANLANTDSLLTFFETLAMWGFVAMWHAQTPADARVYRRWMWAGFALAFMTKGPPALLPLLSVLLYRRFSGLKFSVSMFSVGSFSLFLAIALPWFVAVTLKDPSLFAYFLGYEVYDRVFSNVHDRNSQWYGPLVVYGPVLLLSLLPWGLLAGILASFRYRAALRAYLQRLRWERFRQIHQESFFLVTWFLIPLLVFCLARSRLWLYILPLLVPMALVIARALQYVPVRRWMAVALAAWIAGLVMIKGYAPRFSHTKDAREIAEMIERVVPAAPQEIIFYEEPAMYGLKFYLGSSVRRVAAESRKDQSYDDHFVDVVRKNPEQSLWMTNLPREPMLQKALAEHGLVGTVLARSEVYSVLSVTRLAQPVQP